MKMNFLHDTGYWMIDLMEDELMAQCKVAPSHHRLT